MLKFRDLRKKGLKRQDWMYGKQLLEVSLSI